MADATKIEWADATFNPWIGCTKVSPACDHCYAEQERATKILGVKWGPGQPRHRTKTWGDPVRWNKHTFCECMKCHWRGELREGVTVKNPSGFYPPVDSATLCPRCKEPTLMAARRRVFCASLADVFDNEVPTSWRGDLWALINATPNLDWLLLTKRIGNVKHMMYDAEEPQPNVWIGATICNQEEADRDIPKLLQVPAAIRFLSIEPMLGPIDLHRIAAKDGFHASALQAQRDSNFYEFDNQLDWVIAGGESGPNARPSHPDWFRSLRDQCAAAGVPFLFKQWGEWREPAEGEEYDTSMGRAQRVPAFIVAPAGTVHCFENEQTTSGGRVMLRAGKKHSGRLLDGVEHNGFPETSHA